MKNLLLSTTLLFVCLLFCSRHAFAQFFPETVHAPCTNCVPSDKYSIISGMPSISNASFQGGQFQWVNQQGTVIQLPAPPSLTKGYQTNNQGTDKYGTFLTLFSGPVSKDKVKFIVSGFIPGVQYTMEYAVASTRTASANSFGSSAILQVGSVEQTPALLATSTTDFGSNVNQWFEKAVQFTATTVEISFTLSASTNIGSGYVNFDIIGKPLHCILPPDKQVELTSNTISTKFPCKSVAGGNFENTIKLPLPTGAQVKWKNTSNLTAANLSFLNQEYGPGEYYAFYYHAANECYSLEASNIPSTAKVTVVHNPTQVPLNLGNSVTVKCPNSSYSLTIKLAPSANDGYGTVRWFDNKSRQGLPVTNETVTKPGTYYAFYYDPGTDCYSVDISTSSVTVSFETPCCKAGTNQVTVQPSSITNTCPSSTVDLTTTVSGNVPPNTQIVWFTNPTHTGTAISNASAVGPGTYYAFIFDPALACYNTDNSTAQVKVTSTLCANNVQVSIKAALQGAMQAAGTKMTNELQTYGGTGLLPTNSPYTIASSYPSINNVAGLVGEVVDWVSVEVRSSSAPQTVLQTKSLLLKPDGAIVDRNGLVPIFNAQPAAVRLVVKHRNHLTVMSNPIANFSSGTSVGYNFTTALSQASNEFGDPAQMVQKNGIWCMRPGDLNVNQDLFVDGVDGSFFNVQFKGDVFNSYDRADINMDGFVDGVDGSLFNTSFYQDIYSTLINY